VGRLARLCRPAGFLLRKTHGSARQSKQPIHRDSWHRRDNHRHRRPRLQECHYQHLISTPNAAVSTLTLRDGTGGTTKHVFNYPNTAAAPLAPVEVMFDPPLCAEAKNTNWTMQASVNASGYNVTVNFVKQ
jgi:hypothetical protein